MPQKGIKTTGIKAVAANGKTSNTQKTLTSKAIANMSFAFGYEASTSKHITAAKAATPRSKPKAFAGEVVANQSLQKRRTACPRLNVWLFFGKIRSPKGARRAPTNTALQDWKRDTLLRVVATVATVASLASALGSPPPEQLASSELSSADTLTAISLRSVPPEAVAKRTAFSTEVAEIPRPPNAGTSAPSSCCCSSVSTVHCAATAGGSRAAACSNATRRAGASGAEQRRAPSVSSGHGGVRASLDLSASTAGRSSSLSRLGGSALGSSGAAAPPQLHARGPELPT
mmetsp:Transcript_68740/g.199426  ORF Transcript_68740/g.199426 Transcript_68740/m.199426 type:complete len:287 (+) Transcript_68740:1480-2340(+)